MRGLNSWRAIADAVSDTTSSIPGVKRKRRRLGVRFPTAFALRYARDLQRYTESLQRVVSDWTEKDLRDQFDGTGALNRPWSPPVMPISGSGISFATVDAPEGMQDALDRLKMALLYVLLPYQIRRLVEKHASAVVESSKRQWTRAMSESGAGAPRYDDVEINSAVSTFVAQNVSLIEAIPEQYHARIMSAVTSGVLAGKSFDEIARAIAATYQDKLAGGIAVDQMGILAGGLSVLYFSQNSLGTYVWCDNRDERVRGNPAGKYPNAKYSHWARNGRVFRWSNPPPDGHPGFAKNCRCWAAINAEEAKGQQGKMAQEGELYDEVAL